MGIPSPAPLANRGGAMPNFVEFSFCSSQDSSPIHSGLLQCLVGKTIGDARRTRVRRRGLWAACVALLLGVGVLLVGIGTGSAKDEGDKDEDAGAKCSEATL